MRTCVKLSYFWDHVQTLSLTRNMRVLFSGEEEAAVFFGKSSSARRRRVQTKVNGFVSLHNVANIVGTPVQLI